MWSNLLLINLSIYQNTKKKTARIERSKDYYKFLSLPLNLMGFNLMNLQGNTEEINNKLQCDTFSNSVQNEKSLKYHLILYMN